MARVADESMFPGCGSRVGEAADIVTESRRRSVLPLRALAGPASAEAAAFEALNREAEMELKLLEAKREKLIESARRLEPAEDSSASEHVELAARHLLEALSRAWAGLLRYFDNDRTAA